MAPRIRLPSRPADQTGTTSVRPWWSTNRIGAVLLDLVEIEIQHRGVADIGDEPTVRALAGDDAVPVADQRR